MAEITGPWRKSSYSGANGNCVELAPTADHGTAMRDSKNPEGPVLFFTKDEIAAFFDAVRAGEFDAA